MSESTRRKISESRTPEEWREHSLRTAAALTPEQRREKSLRGAASQTAEQRREKALKGAAAQTPAQRSAKATKRWIGATLEEREKAAERARNIHPDVRLAMAHKQWRTKYATMLPEQQQAFDAPKRRLMRFKRAVTKLAAKPVAPVEDLGYGC
jgi:hypothetical protein